MKKENIVPVSVSTFGLTLPSLSLARAPISLSHRTQIPPDTCCFFVCLFLRAIVYTKIVRLRYVSPSLARWVYGHMRLKLHSSGKGEFNVRSLGHMSEVELYCRATRRTEMKIRVKQRESLSNDWQRARPYGRLAGERERERERAKERRRLQFWFSKCLCFKTCQI